MDLPRSSILPSLSVLISLALILPGEAHAGKLKSVRGQVSGEHSQGEERSGGASPSSGEPSGTYYGRPRESDCPSGDYLCYEEMRTGKKRGEETESKSKPKTQENSEGELGTGWVSRRYHFLRWPYMNGAEGVMGPPSPYVYEPPEPERDGSYIIQGNEEPPPRKRSDLRPLALRLGAEYGYGFERIHKPSAFLLFSSAYRIGFEMGGTLFSEQSRDGHLEDRLIIGDAGIVLRFLHRPTLQLRGGLGCRLMYDEGDVFGGFNSHLGLDYFPSKPFVVSLRADLGNLGEAFLIRVKPQVGLALRMFELYFAWDFWNFSSAGFARNTVISGPVLGLRVWL